MAFKNELYNHPAGCNYYRLFGKLATNSGMSWYNKLKLPKIAPPGYVIGMVWTFLFILMAIAVLLFWNKPVANPNFNIIVVLLLLNAILNILWCVLFFTLHSPYPPLSRFLFECDQPGFDNFFSGRKISGRRYYSSRILSGYHSLPI